MKVQHLFIPGRLQDGYLYRGWFIGLTDYRSLRFVELKALPNEALRFLQSSVSSNGEAAIGETDLGEPTPGGVVSQVSPVVVQAAGEFTREVDVVVDAKVILDLAVYREHLYLGTDNGLFSAPLELSATGRRFDASLERQHDAHALKVTTRFDSVIVSCGDDGLFGAVRASEAPSSRLSLRKLQHQSLKNAWLRSSLVNYPSHRDWEILPTTEEGWSDGEHRWRVVDFPPNNRFGLSSLMDEIRQKKPDFDQDDVQFSFNSDRYIFIHTFAGEFFSLRLGKRLGVSRVYFHQTYKGTGVRILSAAPLGDGIVIETQNRVFLFARERWFHLVDRDVLSVRTFQSSRKFRNIASIATEDGLHLVSVKPDKPSRP
jgi:hypothetical protein